jgi:serine/threonine protein kinase
MRIRTRNINNSRNYTSSVDRILPFCSFCLKENKKKELYIGKDEIRPKCYMLSASITLYRIENAIKKEFIPCIHRKYKHLVCCEENVQYFLVTEDIYRQFVYLKKRGALPYSARLRKNAICRNFFQFLVRYGFIISRRSGISGSDGSLKKIIPPKDVTLTGAITSNIFSGYKEGKKIVVKYLRDNGIGKKVMANTINCINRLGRQTFLPTVLDYDLDSLFYIVEYIEGVNLSEYLKDRNKEERSEFAYSIVKMVSKLNSVGIVHQDLNISQFIVTDNKKLVMMDLDSLCLYDLNSKYETDQVTFEYIEPERMCTNPFTLIRKPYIMDFKVQAYQLGILVFTIFFDVPPCYDITWKMLCKQKKEYDISDFLSNNLDSVPFPFARLLCRSLSREKKERYSAPREMLTDIASDRAKSHKTLKFTSVDDNNLL